MKRLIEFLFALLLITVALVGCATAEKAEAPQAQSEGAVIDVGQMSIYCAVRGKILALVAVAGDFSIAGGACADPPGQKS